MYISVARWGLTHHNAHHTCTDCNLSWSKDYPRVFIIRPSSQLYPSPSIVPLANCGTDDSSGDPGTTLRIQYEYTTFWPQDFEAGPTLSKRRIQREGLYVTCTSSRGDSPEVSNGPCQPFLASIISRSEDFRHEMLCPFPHEPVFL